MRIAFRLALRLLIHPASLAMLTAIIIYLWIPFGEGYYGWPWENTAARVGMIAFVLAVPLLGAAGCAAATGPKSSAVRFLVAGCTLIAGLYGVFAMFNWLSVYPRHF